ncbi:MAG: transporter substrate-binding domain-containing protein [Kordiimonadaceae bacterium]|nr:transporter substrate-binding domain-containing protein [Kordiimonadaceae bacterium]
MTPFGAAWQAILETSGISVIETRVTQGRRRRMFLDGLLVLDCCFNPAWRNRPAETKVQLFTDSFFETRERYVFKKGQVVPIKSPKDLKGLVVVAVRGYTYTHEKYFGETILVQSTADVLRLIEAGRGHVSIISEVDFKARMMRTQRELELGALSGRVAIHARVHQDHAGLLPKLNAAIATLKKEGQLKKTILNWRPK